MSQSAAANPSPDGQDQAIKLTMDGMDHANFKTPRNLNNNKDSERLWRPTLHKVGVIVDGHFEMNFIMDTNTPKDANMNCTIISRVLDVVNEKLESCS